MEDHQPDLLRVRVGQRHHRAFEPGNQLPGRQGHAQEAGAVPDGEGDLGPRRPRKPASVPCLLKADEEKEERKYLLNIKSLLIELKAICLKWENIQEAHKQEYKESVKH